MSRFDLGWRNWNIVSSQITSPTSLQQQHGNFRLSISMHTRSPKCCDSNFKCYRDMLFHIYAICAYSFGNTVMLLKFVFMLLISPTYASLVRCTAASFVSLYLCFQFLRYFFKHCHQLPIFLICVPNDAYYHIYVFSFLLWMAHTCCLILFNCKTYAN
jgi:hypothetical protein